MFQLSKGYLSSGSATETFEQQDQHNVLQNAQLHAAHCAAIHMTLTMFALVGFWCEKFTLVHGYNKDKNYVFVQEQ
jgi:hypothetical protein